MPLSRSESPDVFALQDHFEEHLAALAEQYVDSANPILLQHEQLQALIGGRPDEVHPLHAALAKVLANSVR